MSRTTPFTLSAAVLLGALAGCTDLYPTAEAARADLPLAGAADLEFEDGRLALQWLDPLARDVSATHRIGPWGGLLTMREPGLNLWVPLGALSSDLDITMTARAGEDVLFDLEPHGTQFNHDVWISIDLSKVLDGKQLVDRLRTCLPPGHAPATVGANDAGQIIPPAWLQASNGKEKKEAKKQQSESESQSNGGSDGGSSSSDDSNDSSDAGDPAQQDNVTDSANAPPACTFAWFEGLEGLDGVYLDSSVETSLARALEDFEVWLWPDGWLTFKTDHFSGYALAM